MRRGRSGGQAVERSLLNVVQELGHDRGVLRIDPAHDHAADPARRAHHRLPDDERIGSGDAGHRVDARLNLPDSSRSNR